MNDVKDKELIEIIILYAFIKIYLCILNLYLIDVLFWIIMIPYLIFNMKKNYIRICNDVKHLNFFIIILCIYIVLNFYLGFIFGYSKNPYYNNIFELLKNLVIQITTIFGVELTRKVLINRNKNNRAVLIITTLVLIMLEIDYKVIINLLENKELLFKYICSTIIPLIGTNLICTYLTKNKSYLYSLLYRILVKLPILLLPILPRLDWFMIGTKNILSLTIIYIIFKFFLVKEKKNVINQKNILKDKICYISTVTFSILIVCFMLGVFRYKPIALLSNSMNPILGRGDIIIYKKINNDEISEIKNNSIIIYTLGEQYIAHRVIKIIKKDGKIWC